MRDLNDLLVAGELPDDPEQGAVMISNDVPRVLTAGDLLRAAHKRAFSPRAKRGCTTGHYRLDQITGGFRPGFVWVFGADTSWGKSSFLVSFSDENIKAGRRVLIVSAEDSEQIYGDRLMARRAKVSASRLRDGNPTPAEMERISEQASKGEDVPLFVDGRGRSAEWLASKTRDVIREHRIDVVAFDYLQALGTDKKSQDRRNEVTWVARVLTDVIKSNNVSGIIFSQVTVQEGKSRPDKHSIRESRDVVNAAEVVLVGWTPEKPQLKQGESVPIVEAGQRCISVEKNKDGAAGALIPMEWNSESACFDTVRDAESERYQGLVDSVDFTGDN